MPFTIQHPDSGLFWNVDADTNKVVLAQTGAKYVLVSATLQNVETLLFVRANPLVESQYEGALSMFLWDIKEDGTIGSLYLDNSIADLAAPDTKWVITEIDDGEVPVKRSSALIEEALNAKAAPVPAPEPLAPVTEAEPEAEPEDEVPDSATE